MTLLDFTVGGRLRTQVGTWKLDSLRLEIQGSTTATSVPKVKKCVLVLTPNPES